jgi:hypothetical protein
MAPGPAPMASGSISEGVQSASHANVTEHRALAEMKAIFVLYLTVISSGIAYFLIIGLTHH